MLVTVSIGIVKRLPRLMTPALISRSEMAWLMKMMGCIETEINSIIAEAQNLPGLDIIGDQRIQCRNHRCWHSCIRTQSETQYLAKDLTKGFIVADYTGRGSKMGA